MTIIRTSRGQVDVLGSACKHRPCLHVHWSEHYSTEKILQTTGAKVRTYPLVCTRREYHGCPTPLPEPVKP